MKKQKIIIATDFSESAKTAIEFAKKFSQKLDADLELVHVFDIAALKLPAFYSESNPLEWVQEVIEKFREEEEIALKKLAQETGLNKHFLEGSPKEEIVNFAHENSVDFLIMGTHGHSGFKKFFLGSVAEYVVRYAKCPVLIAKQLERSKS